MKTDLERLLGATSKLSPVFAAIPDDAPLTSDDVAKLLGKTSQSVRRWIRSGIMPAYQSGGHYIINGNDFKEFMIHTKKRSYKGEDK